MMLQLGDDGVLRKADEENLISVDEKELDELIDKANELLEENQHIKQTIKTMMETERTALGRSVLKQLWEAIQ